MTDVPFLSFNFAATGATATRTLPDRLADYVNVKDYGATGNGTTDDTVAIQAAFDAAWTISGVPNAESNVDKNRPVVFPAGRYKITQTIYVESVLAGRIIGAGSRSTSLIYSGAIPNVFPVSYSKTSLFFFNGSDNCSIEGISFVMTGGNAQADNTVCLNWNWNGPTTPAIKTSHLLCIDVGFSGGTYGFLAADDEGAPGWGYQGDIACFVNCWIDNCRYGLKTVEANCIQAAWVGGRITNCNQTDGFGLWYKSYGVGTVMGTYFENNYYDLQMQGGAPNTVIGCYTKSTNFASVGERSSLIGCEQHAASAGNFAITSPDWGASIDGCKSVNGVVAGRGDFFIQETQFGNSSWGNYSLMRIREYASAVPLTFSTLPTSPGEGLLLSITDAVTATWGAAVSAGGGSNHVWIRWNGSAWTVVGN